MKLVVKSMRLFIAVPISEEVSFELDHWVTTNREEVFFRKWVHPTDYHITIQFLGEINVDKIEALQACLRSIRSNPIVLRLNGAGYFGSPHSPHVLYVPHITIARNYIGKDRFPSNNIKSVPSGINWVVDRFMLMRTCSNTSPMYEVIESYPLRK